MLSLTKYSPSLVASCLESPASIRQLSGLETSVGSSFIKASAAEASASAAAAAPLSKVNPYLLPGDHRPEQRAMLQYIYIDESKVAGIKGACQEKNLEVVVQIAQFINKGQWTEFIQYSKQWPLSTNEFSYLMLASYCTENISTRNLYVTANMFYNISRLDGEEESLKSEVHPIRLHEINWKKCGVNVEENERYRIKCHEMTIFYPLVREEVRNIIRRSAKWMERIGFHDQHYILPSFSILNKIYSDSGVKLNPIIGLTSSRRDVISRVSQDNLSDFALYFPEDRFTVHGIDRFSIFFYVHDLYHAERRIEKIKYPELVQHAFQLFNVIQKILDQFKLNYFDKLVKDYVSYPVFMEPPTKEELFNYILRVTSALLIDAEYPFKGGHVNVEDLVNHAIDKLVELQDGRAQRDRNELFVGLESEQRRSFIPIPKINELNTKEQDFRVMLEDVRCEVFKLLQADERVKDSIGDFGSKASCTE